MAKFYIDPSEIGVLRGRERSEKENADLAAKRRKKRRTSLILQQKTEKWSYRKARQKIMPTTAIVMTKQMRPVFVCGPQASLTKPTRSRITPG